MIMSNHSVLKKFVDHWRDSPGFEVNDCGNCRFHARVKYEFRTTELVHTTLVSIQRNGYEDGKVSLEEAGPLVSEVFHLDFSPDWQIYKYGSSHDSLIVKGDSGKMGGEYRVVITPVIV